MLMDQSTHNLVQNTRVKENLKEKINNYLELLLLTIQEDHLHDDHDVDDHHLLHPLHQYEQQEKVWM